jgi:hypothetical protein
MSAKLQLIVMTGFEPVMSPCEASSLPVF